MYKTNKFCHLCSSRLFSRVWTSQSAACMCVTSPAAEEKRYWFHQSTFSPTIVCLYFNQVFYTGWLDVTVWKWENLPNTNSPPQLPSWVSSRAADVAEQREQKVPVVFPSAALDWMPPATVVSHHIHLHCWPAYIFIYILSRRVQVPTGWRRLWPCGNKWFVIFQPWSQELCAGSCLCVQNLWRHKETGIDKLADFETCPDLFRALPWINSLFLFSLGRQWMTAGGNQSPTVTVSVCH